VWLRGRWSKWYACLAHETNGEREKTRETSGIAAITFLVGCIDVLGRLHGTFMSYGRAFGGLNDPCDDKSACRLSAYAGQLQKPRRKLASGFVDDASPGSAAF
jgi:hypothetical protein